MGGSEDKKKLKAIMKTRSVHSSLVPVLLAGLGLLLAGRAPAQTFTTLHSFTLPNGNGSPNSDGTYPYDGLVLSGNTLYGTASAGGTNHSGTVFAVNTVGSSFTTVYNFTGGNDGVDPVAGLILSGNMLYGTAASGGTNGYGTVFKVKTDGTGFTVLHSFTSLFFSYTNSDGGGPWGGLVLSGNTLYGTTLAGGTNGWGTVFAVNTDGNGFTNLHNFNGADGAGAEPQAGLVLSGNTLYGTTYYLTAYPGGGSGYGTVFAVNTNGTGFTNLYTFTGTTDRGHPTAGLILSGNTLYGTTLNGTVFAVNTDGTGFTNVYTFTGTYEYTNSDGANPSAGLILSGNTLYGTAENGGNGGEGTVFAVNTNGTGFTTLHSFTPLTDFPNNTNIDGANPIAGLVLSGNTLYGTAHYGGRSGRGTVFALSLPVPPSMGFTTAGNKIVLSWPTNASSFALQFITNLSSGSWSNVTSGIYIVGTNNVFTNTMNGNAAFFRLMQ